MEWNRLSRDHALPGESNPGKIDPVFPDISAWSAFSSLGKAGVFGKPNLYKFCRAPSPAPALVDRRQGWRLWEVVRGTKSISGQNVIIIRQIAVRSYYRPFWKGGGKACGSCLGLVVLVVMVKRATVMSAFYECLGDTKFPVT